MIFLLYSLQRLNDTVLEFLNALGHILALILALNVEINDRYVILVAAILRKKLILHFFIEILIFPVLLLNDSSAPLG
jgi:hypothetical protein